MKQKHSLLTLMCVLALCIIRLRLNICLDILLMFNRDKAPVPLGILHGTLLQKEICAAVNDDFCKSRKSQFVVKTEKKLRERRISRLH